MSFDVRPDERCLRGLHWVYVAHGLAPARLVEEMRVAFPRHLVEGTEQWGPVTVQRLIVQFRFELRLGVRADEVSLLHRVTATPAQRAHDRALVEASLRASLAESSS